MCDFFVVVSTFDELNIGKVLCNISHPLLKVGYNKKKFNPSIAPNLSFLVSIACMIDVTHFLRYVWNLIHKRMCMCALHMY